MENFKVPCDGSWNEDSLSNVVKPALCGRLSLPEIGVKKNDEKQLYGESLNQKIKKHNSAGKADSHGGAENVRAQWTKTHDSTRHKMDIVFAELQEQSHIVDKTSRCIDTHATQLQDEEEKQKVDRVLKQKVKKKHSSGKADDCGVKSLKLVRKHDSPAKVDSHSEAHYKQDLTGPQNSNKQKMTNVFAEMQERSLVLKNLDAKCTLDKHDVLPASVSPEGQCFIEHKKALTETDAVPPKHCFDNIKGKDFLDRNKGTTSNIDHNKAELIACPGKIELNNGSSIGKISERKHVDEGATTNKCVKPDVLMHLEKNKNKNSLEKADIGRGRSEVKKKTNTGKTDNSGNKTFEENRTLVKKQKSGGKADNLGRVNLNQGQSENDAESAVIHAGIDHEETNLLGAQNTRRHQMTSLMAELREHPQTMQKRLNAQTEVEENTKPLPQAARKEPNEGERKKSAGYIPEPHCQNEEYGKLGHDNKLDKGTTYCDGSVRDIGGLPEGKLDLSYGGSWRDRFKKKHGKGKDSDEVNEAAMDDNNEEKKCGGGSLKKKVAKKYSTGNVEKNDEAKLKPVDSDSHGVLSKFVELRETSQTVRNRLHEYLAEDELVSVEQDAAQREMADHVVEGTSIKSCSTANVDCSYTEDEEFGIILLNWTDAVSQAYADSILNGEQLVQA